MRWFNVVFQLISPWCRVYSSVIQVSIGTDNGLSPIRCQTIIWTSAWLLSIGPLGTMFSEILTKIENFSFTRMRLTNNVCEKATILSRGKRVKFMSAATVKTTVKHIQLIRKKCIYKYVKLHRKIQLDKVEFIILQTTPMMIIRSTQL